MAQVMNFNPEARSEGVAHLLFGLNRPQLMTLLMLVAVSNAMLSSIVGSIQSSFFYAAANTFDVSAVVWFGLYLGVVFLWKIEATRITFTDKAISALVLISCMLPLGPATWIVVSSLALYLIVKAKGATSYQARGGWIFFALAVPMFWSKRIFNMFSEFFLSIDATLVSNITNTERTGNLVAMPGGSGYLQIAAPCSSMANVSLALLCWVLFTQTARLRWHPSNIFWCLGACLSVVVINVVRITLIGYFPHYYDVLHGPAGNTAASWLSVFAMGGVCYLRSLRVNNAKI